MSYSLGQIVEFRPVALWYPTVSFFTSPDCEKQRYKNVCGWKNVALTGNQEMI